MYEQEKEDLVQVASAKQEAQAMGKDEVPVGHTVYQPPPQAAHRRFDGIVTTSKLQGSRKVKIKTKKEDVKLRECEYPWRPARCIVYTNITEEERKTWELYKKVRGVLNKLAPQKFETLLDQFRSLGIDNTERLQGVIDLVFEKAVDEPNYSVVYALLCRELALMQVPATESKRKEGQEFVNFRKLLVTRCQLEFEKNSVDEKERSRKIKEMEDCTDPEKKKDMQLDLEEYDRRLRMKSVGNIRFIGELFNQQMLTVNIMLRCLNNLLDTKDEESVECLCMLLKTVGKELESEKVDLGSIFSVMKDIADKKHENIGNKFRFMVQDVIDLRVSRWVPRKQQLIPKTMDQIKIEAECKYLTGQGILPWRKERGVGKGVNASATKKRRNVGIDDDWSTATSRGDRNRFTVQRDDLKNKALMMGEPLGSIQMFGNWGRGSNIKTTPQPPVMNTANLYAALENIGTKSDKRPTPVGGDFSPVSQSDSPSLEQNQLSYEEMHDQLLAFFKSGTSFDDTTNWIAANVGERVKENQFIRTLATACFKDSIVNLKLKADILHGKYNLLHRFVDNKPAYELQCLYALQTLINKLEHPRGLLLAICDKLYEENVFSHESFLAWEANKDPAEQEGKRVALKQLSSFFRQLKEADEDSSSSEDA